MGSDTHNHFKLDHGVIRQWLTTNGFDLEKLHGRMNSKYRRQYSNLCCELLQMIDRYGETGFGNKPEDMSPTAYWVQHLDFERMFGSCSDE